MKLFITDASKFNFDFHKNILFSQRLFIKHDVSCVRPTQNSTLPKRPYPDVSNGKVKTSIIHVNVINATGTGTSTIMSRFSKHSIPLDFTDQCRLSYNREEKWLMC